MARQAADIIESGHQTPDKLVETVTQLHRNAASTVRGRE